MLLNTVKIMQHLKNVESYIKKHSKESKSINLAINIDDTTQINDEKEEKSIAETE